MTAATLARRLAQVEQTARALSADVTGEPPFLIAYPDTWPAEERAAFDGGDDAARAAAIARQTGRRPGPTTLLIIVRHRLARRDARDGADEEANLEPAPPAELAPDAEGMVAFLHDLAEVS